MAIFFREFPQLYRALLPYTTVAFALFLMAAIGTFILVARDPQLLLLLMGEQVAPLVAEVLAVGGANGDLVTLIPQASTEIWDPATGMWSAGPALPAANSGYAPWNSPQGELFIIGGATTGGPSAVSRSRWR